MRLHAYLFADGQRTLGLGVRQKPNAIYCKRDNMIAAGKADWMEWHAGYACGASLMPHTFVNGVLAPVKEARRIFGRVSSTGSNGLALIETVAAAFGVSHDAARVRLTVLGSLGPEAAVASLFP